MHVILKMSVLAAGWFAVAPAQACSVAVPWSQYVNLVRMTGPPIAGLRWIPVHNVLDYEGEGPVTVSIIRQGKRVVVARWRDGQECALGGPSPEHCVPNRPGTGIGLERWFTRWEPRADHARRLRRLYLPLIVETATRELRLTLRSQAVRNTRHWHGEAQVRAINEICIEGNLE
jgi:hypothetical protein